MNKPTTQDKLFALAAAAAKSAKDGNLGRAINTINIMAHVCDEASYDKAREILHTLKETEPKLEGVEDHFSSVKMDLDPDAPPDEDGLNIDTARFTHEEMLFLLVTLLGGNMRALAEADVKEDKKASSHNIAKIINMILHWVTKEDWEKAHAMIENREPPQDRWSNYLGA